MRTSRRQFAEALHAASPQRVALEVSTRGDAILVRDPHDMNKKRKIARAIAKLEGTLLVPAWKVAAVCHCDRCVARLQGRKVWREELCPCSECQHSREGV